MSHVDERDPLHVPYEGATSPTTRKTYQNLQHIAQGSPLWLGQIQSMSSPDLMQLHCLAFHWLRPREREKEIEEKEKSGEGKEGNTKKDKTDKHNTHRRHARARPTHRTRNTSATRTATPQRHIRNISAQATTAKGRPKKRRARNRSQERQKKSCCTFSSGKRRRTWLFTRRLSAPEALKSTPHYPDLDV